MHASRSGLDASAERNMFEGTRRLNRATAMLVIEQCSRIEHCVNRLSDRSLTLPLDEGMELRALLGDLVVARAGVLSAAVRQFPDLDPNDHIEWLPAVVVQD